MGQRGQWKDSWQREWYEQSSREKEQALCGDQHHWDGVGTKGEGREEDMERWKGRQFRHCAIISAGTRFLNLASAWPMMKSH